MFSITKSARKSARYVTDGAIAVTSLKAQARKRIRAQEKAFARAITRAQGEFSERDEMRSFRVKFGSERDVC